MVARAAHHAEDPCRLSADRWDSGALCYAAGGRSGSRPGSPASGGDEQHREAQKQSSAQHPAADAILPATERISVARAPTSIENREHALTR